jgi:hypothetical protein
MGERCKHRRRWLLVSDSVGQLQWCYECGAIRDAGEQWIRPTGKGGENPAMLTPPDAAPAQPESGDR